MDAVDDDALGVVDDKDALDVENERVIKSVEDVGAYLLYLFRPHEEHMPWTTVRQCNRFWTVFSGSFQECPLLCISASVSLSHVFLEDDGGVINNVD